MPSWLEPLPLDEALVDAAVLACQQAASVLTVVTEEREGCLRWAGAEWRGPHHDLAVLAATALATESVALAGALRSAAAAMETNRQHVRQQNVVRAAGRQRWLADQGGG